MVFDGSSEKGTLRNSSITRYLILNNCAQILKSNLKSAYFMLNGIFLESSCILDLLESALTDFSKISSTASQSTIL